MWESSPLQRLVTAVFLHMLFIFKLGFHGVTTVSAQLGDQPTMDSQHRACLALVSGFYLTASPSPTLCATTTKALLTHPPHVPVPPSPGCWECQNPPFYFSPPCSRPAPKLSLEMTSVHIWPMYPFPGPCRMDLGLNRCFLLGTWRLMPKRLESQLPHCFKAFRISFLTFPFFWFERTRVYFCCHPENPKQCISLVFLA